MIRYLIFILIFHSQAKAQQLIPYLQDSLYGYATLDGQLVVQPKYEHAELFNEQNIAYATENGVWKILASDGQEIISYESTEKPKLNQVTQNSDEHLQFYGEPIEHLYWLQYPDDKFQIVNIQTKQASEVFIQVQNLLAASSFRCSPIKFQYGCLVIETVGGKFQVLNLQGKVMLETEIKPIVKNAAIITYQDSNSTRIFFLDGRAEQSFPFKSINQIVISTGTYC